MHVKLPQLNKVLDAKKGDNLFLRLRDEQVPIASSCNGDGVCGKCVVTVVSGKLDTPNTLEASLLEKYNHTAEERISCQCLIGDDLVLTTTYW
jgi:ferredoxin, 2Fe-2S